MAGASRRALTPHPLYGEGDIADARRRYVRSDGWHLCGTYLYLARSIMYTLVT